ncbi:MAG: glycosyltransferase [Pyrinomonadaceae bacterium]
MGATVREGPVKLEDDSAPRPHKGKSTVAPNIRPTAWATTRRIAVLHVISDLSTGGAEMMLYKLLSRTDRKRFAPFVLTLKDHGELRKNIEALNVPVYSLAIRYALPTPISMWRLLRLLRYLKPDIIQGWMSHSNLTAQIGSLFSPGRVAVVWNIRQTLHSLHREKSFTRMTIKLGALLSGTPDVILYNSLTGAAQHQSIGYRADRTLLIPNGFDVTLFAPSTLARHSVRAELGVAQATLLIGCVARYHPMKDHQNFLHAAAHLLKTLPRVQFVCVGTGVDWDNEALRQLMRELKLTGRVHLLGERRDIPRLTAALDIAVSSSSFGEGFPNVIGEAMSCGVPCVVTDISDLRQIVGETGRVVPPRDSNAMAAALRELVEIGPGGREALGRAARARIEDCFHLDSVVAQYEALYEAVTSEEVRGELKASARHQQLLERLPPYIHRQSGNYHALKDTLARSSQPRLRR